MELIERVNLSVAKWLLTQSKQQLASILKNKTNDPSTIDEKYNRLQNYLKSAINTNGVIKKLYTYSLNSNNELGGRLFSKLSIQSVQRDFRGILMQHTTDVDMVNAHPVILRYICSLHNIKCPNLDYYINHRTDILNEFDNPDSAKTLFLCSINDSKFSRSEKNKFYKLFDKEMKEIQKILYRMEEYSNIKQNIKSDNNKPGKLISFIMSQFENKILQSAISFINQRNIVITALMFDGLMIEGNFYEDEILLNELTTFVNTQFLNLNMQWKYKPHSDTIKIPDNIDTEYIEQDEPSKEDVKKQELLEQSTNIKKQLDNRVIEFEKNHCKIKNKGLYLHNYINSEGSDVIQFLTYKQITENYRDLEIAFNRYHLDRGSIVPVSFINYWTENNPGIRKYDDVEIYPDPSLCPPNIYNLWTPFYGEKLLQDSNISVNQEYIDFFRNHLRILSGNDGNIQNYFEKWIAHCLQYPEQKSTCPILISQQGAGKGTLNKTIQLLLGGNKYLETTNPLRDIWGAFNSQMADSFFVNINEVGKKDMLDSMGLLKALVTDPSLTINTKGLIQYKITSYHRFIFTTNNIDPIHIEKGDRRFWIIRSSDELIGNKEYFNKYNLLLKDKEFLKSIYFYFITMPNVDQFIKLDLPITEYQSKIMESNISDVEKWLRSYVLLFSTDTERIVLIKDLYQSFTQWSEEENNKYKLSSKKFSLELSILQFKGIYKGDHTRYGDTKKFNIVELKQHFGIGCVIDLPMGDVDEGIL
jgi:hypothetical protein